MSGQFEGKVALVTGGNSGIGKAAALAFAREGAKVAIAARREKEGEETVEEIKESDGHAIFVKTDVSDESQIEAMVKTVVGAYGRLDFAFNNAGVTGPDWNRIIAVNLTGVWRCMMQEIPHMVEQGRGAIVNNSSLLGLVGAAGAYAYAAGKHGVVGLTRCAALEYAKQGVRVNAVCPAYIDTPMVIKPDDNPGRREELGRMHPVGRIGTPEEVAAAVIWLCSDAASFITGEALRLDGGALAGVVVRRED